MPYYSYGYYGDFLANNIYCILLIPVFLLSIWAQFQVSGNFRRYSEKINRRYITGAQAAEAVLERRYQNNSACLMTAPCLCTPSST